MLEATLARFDPAQPGFNNAANPLSPAYGGRMVDAGRIHLWTWDARPFPAFPNQSSVWADAGNWELGHWLTGRLEGLPLDRLVATILADSGVANAAAEFPELLGFLDGYALDRVMSARGAIEPLASLFGFDGIVSGGRIDFRSRGTRPVRALTEADLVADKDGRFVALTRMQESELPHELATSFVDAEHDYRTSAVYSRRIEGHARRVAEGQFAATLRRGVARHLLDIWLQDLWIARETIQFSLRPGLIDIEVGDMVSLLVDGLARPFLVQKITDGFERRTSARAIEPALYDRPVANVPRVPTPPPRPPGPPRVVVLDLALSRDTPETLQHIAVFADPWHAGMAVWRQASGGGTYDFVRVAERPAMIGDTLDVLGPGPVGRIDYANSVTVRFASGAPASVSDVEMLGGKTACAIRGADGAWEIFCFGRAELVADKTYRLSRLLRGLGGEDFLAGRAVPAGATVVLLDNAVVPLASGLSSLGTTSLYRVGPASRDYADAAYVSASATVTSKALKPYAPAQARATRSAAGVTIGFRRRGRLDADAGEPVEIPLGEDAETHDIDIRAGAAVKRTLTVATPQALYAAADELADFGAPQATLAVSIAERSTSVGRGFALAVTLPVT